MFFLVILPIFSPFPFLNFFSKSVVRFDWKIFVKFKLLVFTQNSLSLLKVSSKFWRHFFHCPGDPSAIYFLLQIENEVFLSWDLVLARKNCENFLNDNGWSSRPICDKPRRDSRCQFRDHGFPLGGFQIPSHWIPAPPSVNSGLPLNGFLHPSRWHQNPPSVDSGLPLRHFCTPLPTQWTPDPPWWTLDSLSIEIPLSPTSLIGFQIPPQRIPASLSAKLQIPPKWISLLNG